MCDTATDGNIALTARLELGADGEAVLALGFGYTAAGAGFRVHASLQTPFETILNDYPPGWRAWQARLRSMERRTGGRNLYRVSTAVLRSHESPNFPGGIIASLSIPWGFSKGDDDLDGCHLVGPRDLSETAGARAPRCLPWRPDWPAARIRAGRVLRLDLPEASMVVHTRDGWRTWAEQMTRDSGLGLHIGEIPTEAMRPGESVEFTWRAQATGTWHGRNHEVAVVATLE